MSVVVDVVVVLASVTVGFAVINLIAHRCACGRWPRFMRPQTAKAHLDFLATMVRAGEITAIAAVKQYRIYTGDLCIYRPWKHDSIAYLFRADELYTDEWSRAVRLGLPRYGYMNEHYPELAGNGDPWENGRS